MALLAIVLGAASAAAQPAPRQTPGTSAERALRVFLDCKERTPCYYDYVKIELAYVDYVNVREAADVHVLVTSLDTGIGGREYTLKFIGQGAFGGMDDEVLYASLPTDAEETVRRGFTRTLALGLVRYVQHTMVGKQLQVLHAPPSGAQAAGSLRPLSDAWDNWVFRARFNASYESEASSTSRNLNGSFSAGRTTDAWKLGVSTHRDSRRSEYNFSDGTYYLSERDSYDVTAMAVKSFTPHWSAGGKAYVAASTYENKNRVLNTTAALEYNFFPYADSTRRQLTFQYLAGLTSFDYIEETIYGKLGQTVPVHVFRTSFDMKQTWGSLSADVDFSQYLHDTQMSRRTVSAEADVRLFRGFALNLSGRISSIQDQLYLQKGEATPEEVLARQRQLATSFRRSLWVGVSYTFGSIFSNVVNTRLSRM